MLEKLLRAFMGEPRETEAGIHIYESGQLALLSTQELERRRLYERIAQHQQLIEIEEDLRRKF